MNCRFFIVRIADQDLYQGQKINIQIVNEP